MSSVRSVWRAALVAVLCAVCLIPLVHAALDYYEVLQVTREATEREIKTSYRRLARSIHPDKHPDKADEFMQLTDAYQTLSDAQLRSVYDRYGADAVKEQQARKTNGGQDPMDVFRQFFGGGAASEEAPRGPQKEYHAELTLGDIFLGRVFSVDHERTVVCPACFGSGAESSKHIHTCRQCGGHGVQVVRQQIMPGFVTNVQVTCTACQGHGRVIEKLCSRCDGAKTIQDRTEIDVEVDAGAREGATYVFPGEADQSPDHDAGDVVVEIRSTTNPGDFRRVGHNLYLSVALSLHEALLGFEKTYIHYDSHAFNIRRDSVTQSGFVARVEGEGMPIPPDEREAAGGRAAGDLFVEYQVVLPQLDAGKRSLLSSFLRRSGAHNEL
ncbi:DnaJ- protein scj1 [Malassezia sp. CBS 17886]|nr:DnaJ- protein scj1 [Malassezia sp. CBS 17886]